MTTEELIVSDSTSVCTSTAEVTEREDVALPPPKKRGRPKGSKNKDTKAKKVAAHAESSVSDDQEEVEERDELMDALPPASETGGKERAANSPTSRNAAQAAFIALIKEQNKAIRELNKALTDTRALQKETLEALKASYDNDSADASSSSSI